MSHIPKIHAVKLHPVDFLCWGKVIFSFTFSNIGSPLHTMVLALFMQEFPITASHMVTIMLD